MSIALSQDFQLENDKKYSFYTDDELALLYKLENGLVPTKTHDQVMENLRKALHLEDK
ncbi:hypothetical protein [Rodentibacter haemolyticus]|uniref:Uncharacterized protein n=1 Tax=Rodentibacter haemolyticus TaxID=2778911 RepID=A0ABX6UZZ1_9PAST|nr:hypothetical protein [Rodentibacter haemolyticus]QPB42821.1 hypothetical protein IHV77_01465 [Rodentibacter haemolyticus]